ncbi:hypothetical protein [Motilibacter peucedani]|nr:hypothetical protein [Motilibacter peucedani]
MATTGRPIERLSRTRAAVFNERGDTVRGGDIVELDRLRLELPDGDAPLNVRILTSSRDQIGFNAVVDPIKPSSVLLTFDFLDAGDGGIVEVLHQGTEAPSLEGTVRGARLHRAAKEPSLSNRALFALAVPGSIRRTLRYSRSILFPLALTALVVVTLGVVIFKTLHSSPRLINPAAYDLSSLQGQAKFAAKVRSDGSERRHQLWIFILPLLLAPLTLIPLLLAGRSSVPSSIVKEELLGLSDEEKTALSPKPIFHGLRRRA